MPLSIPTRRPLSCWKSILRQSRRVKISRQPLSTIPRSSSRLERELLPLASPFSSARSAPKKLKTYPPPPSTRARVKDPIALLASKQLSLLDPTGARQNLFSRTNREAAKVGDVLLVRLRNGDPFAGVCLNIRRRGVDTGILLRNQLTRVGVEMWFKIFSPNVEGIEVVQRREKRARRARLYYMRKPKHDMGSVQNIVLQYQRQKMVLGSGDNGRGSDSNVGKKGKKNDKR
ncbi:MAG: hypothetical protein M1813_003672 [Trichoglossum hirsutum]|nr:MAG: hypothetical protein M1813_003672 [Trichoglossum hirsutum]